MSALFDSQAESHTGTTGSASEGSFSFTLTPVVARLRGVLVFTFVNANADNALSVTANGVPLTAVSGGLAADTTGEPGQCKAWYVGKELPPGALTILVTRTNNANVMYAVAYGIAADRDTEIKGTPVLLQNDGTLAVQAVDVGAIGHATRFAGINSGLTTAPSAGTGSTAGPLIQFGSRSCRTVRETAPGAGSRNVGFSSGTSDDRAAVHLAVGEVVEVSGLKPDRPQFRPAAPRTGVTPEQGRRPPPSMGRRGPGVLMAEPREERPGFGEVVAAFFEASVTVVFTASADLTAPSLEPQGGVEPWIGRRALGPVGRPPSPVGMGFLTKSPIQELQDSSVQAAAAEFAAAVSVTFAGVADLTTLTTFDASVSVAFTSAADLTTEITLAAAVVVAFTTQADLTAEANNLQSGVSDARRSPPIGVPGPGRPGILTLNPGAYWRLQSSAAVADTTVAGAASINITASADLTTEIRMAVAVNVTVTASASLTTAIEMAGTATVAFSTAADLSVTTSLEAVVSVTFSATGDLTTAIELAASASLAFSVTGVMEGANLAASVSIVFTAVGSMTTASVAFTVMDLSHARYEVTDQSRVRYAVAV